MTEDEKKFVKVTFAWKSLQPDRRQWKPSSPIFEPLSTLIAVDVPFSKDYIYNIDGLKEGTKTGLELVPILTPKGMRYCIDQFESVMNDVSTQEDEKVDESKEEWNWG